MPFLNDDFAAALGRCNSTPGLLESQGQVPLEEMWVNPEGDGGEKVVSTARRSGSPCGSSLLSSEEDKSHKTGQVPKIMTPGINYEGHFSGI